MGMHGRPERIKRSHQIIMKRSQNRISYRGALSFFLILAGWPVLTWGHALSINGYFESTHIASPKHSILERAEKYHIEVEPDRQVWRIDDLTTPPRNVFSFKDFVLAQNAFQDSTKVQLEASLFFDGYPIDLEGDQRLLWFVYCARDYLRSKDGERVILPHGEPRSDVELDACRAKVKWRNHDDLCPNVVEFTYESKLMKESIDLLTLEPPGNTLNEREHRFRNLQQMQQDGELRARFEVSEWDNQDDIGVPKTWRLTMFFRGQPLRVYSGSSERAEVIGDVNTPTIPVSCEVRDKRVRNVEKGLNLIQYTITDGSILDLDSELVRTGVAKATFATNRLMPPDYFWRRAMIIAATTLLLTVPIIVLFKQKRAN